MRLDSSHLYFILTKELLVHICSQKRHSVFSSAFCAMQRKLLDIVVKLPFPSDRRDILLGAFSL